MRFFKLFFSRFFLLALGAIIQIATFYVTLTFLNEYVWIIKLVLLIVSVGLYFKILNKNCATSSKLPWLMIFAFFPILGITIYFTFNTFQMKRKARKYFLNNKDELKDFIDLRIQPLLDLKNENSYAFGQCSYIANTNALPTYKNCYNEYLKTGEDFFEKLKEELNKAKEYILMEYFIIEEGTMFNEIYEILKLKVKQGVEVYFMYDDVGSLGKVDTQFYKKMIKDGIKCVKFGPLRGIVCAVYNNRDHRKITVIDGEVGFVSGANIADEYININSPFGKWKDNAILVKGNCVDSLVKLFFELYNYNIENKVSSKKYLKENHQLYQEEGYITPYGDGPYPVYKDYVGKNVYLNMINQATKYIYITTPYLIVDYEFQEALINAAKRGVNVTIITPHIPDKKMVYLMTRSSYIEFVKYGVNIYEYKEGFIHAKTFVVDDTYATISTINLDYRSLIHHFECGIWMYNTSTIKDIKSDFINMIENECLKINKEDAKLNVPERMLKSIIRIIAPLL